MTAKKKISRTAAGKNDGIKGPGDQLQNGKLTAKYTLWRSKEDVEKLETVRKCLQHKYSYKSYKADSKIYNELPDLFLNAVKTIAERDLAIDELTAKLDQLEDLRTSFCRILELCDKTDDESSCLTDLPLRGPEE